jgi:hypothetical protein
MNQAYHDPAGPGGPRTLYLFCPVRNGPAPDLSRLSAAPPSTTVAEGFGDVRGRRDELAWVQLAGIAVQRTRTWPRGTRGAMLLIQPQGVGRTAETSSRASRAVSRSDSHSCARGQSSPVAKRSQRRASRRSARKLALQCQRRMLQLRAPRMVGKATTDATSRPAGRVPSRSGHRSRWVSSLGYSGK